MSIKIVFEKYVEMEDNIIFCAFDHNVLYSMSLVDKKVNYLAMIPCKRFGALRDFFSIINYKEKIVLVPFNEDDVYVFDLFTHEFEKIYLKRVDEIKNPCVSNPCSEGKFACCSIVDNQLVLFPHFYPALVQINMDTYEVFYDLLFISELQVKKDNIEPYIGCVFTEKEYMYAASSCNNLIVKYNPLDYKKERIPIPYSGYGINGLLKVGDMFYIAPRVKGPIATFSIETKVIREYGDYPSGYNYSAISFRALYKSGEDIYLIPALSNQMIKLNIASGKMENIKIVSETLKYGEGFNIDRLLSYRIHKNTISFIDAKSHSWCEYNFETNVMIKYELYCEHSWIEEKDVYNEILDLYQDELLFESNLISLDGFVSMI